MKVYRIYKAEYEKEGNGMSADNVLELCSTMASLWRNLAMVIVGVAMVLSTSLSEHIHFVTGPYALLGTVAAVAVVGSFILNSNCKKM